MNYRFIVACISLSVATSIPAFGEDAAPGGTIKKITDAKAVVIGNRESSSPFSYLGDDNKPTGFSVDVCKYVVSKIATALKIPGLETKFMTVSPAARVPLLANGTIDLDCETTSITQSRLTQVDFSLPIFAVTTRILTKTSSGIKDWSDLKDKVVGVAAGTTGEQTINKMVQTDPFKGTRVLTLKDHAAGILALETGRIDSYVTDDIILEGLRDKSRQKNDFIVTGKPLAFQTYAIAFRRGDADFRTLVDSALADLYRSNDIQTIYSKWFQPLGVSLSTANDYVYKIGSLEP